jgi:Flp pilus assembly protein TadG
MRRHLFGSGSDKSAAVAPTVALSLFALIGAAGIAFDYARMASLDTELQSAADQAALAAASQLDGEDGACGRAVAAARELLANQTVMGNDGGGLAVTIADSAVCTSDTEIVDDPDASIRFFEDKAGLIPATDNLGANFVEVVVDSRRASFALTPVVSAFSSGDLSARARAGLGTALCKVPPLMICNPTPGVEVDWNAMRGRGVQAVAGAGWTPGGFGYIGPNDANATQMGLAFQNPVFQCQEINAEENVSTGAPAPAIVAVNTRFDVYDMSGGAGQVLTPCLGAACPPALNVTKDLVRSGTGTTGNSCKIHNNGWQLPATNRRFRPVPTAGTDPLRLIQTAGQPIDAMGLPRDNCHYTSFAAPAGTCSRLGNGDWARGDYFHKYHPTDTPAGAGTMTRYETYLWEITNSSIPNVVASGSGGSALWQRGRPLCNATVPDSTRDRRVLQVAIGGNCNELHGSSTPVEIEKWVEMFLVEPGVPNPGRGNGDSGNEIYLEVIREVDPGGAAAQIIRRDVPYLVR